MVPHPHRNPLPVLPAPLRAAIAAFLPGADLARATPLGEGIGTLAFRIQSPEGPWVARLSKDYPEPWTWRGGRGYEVPLLRALADAGLRVPQHPVAIPAANGLPVAILEREVEGTRLARPLRGRRASDLARDLAEFLTGLHRFPASAARAFGVPVAGMDGSYREAIARAERFLRPGVRLWLEQQLQQFERQRPPSVLVHRDFRADHIIVDARGRLSGVIDFGDTAIGDPAVDFAWISGELGAGFIKNMLDHYEGPADGLLQRARLYHQLDPLFEVAGADDVDGWWDRSDALRRLAARAAAATRASR